MLRTNNTFLSLAVLSLAFATGQPHAQAANAGGGPAPEQSLAAGKWKYFAQGTCICEDNKCKVVTCTGESGVSYEDARFKAQLSLAAQARSENGRIVGAPSITVRFESK